MVSALACYSDDPSSNPADTYSFFLYNLCLKRKKINKKKPGLAHLKKMFLEYFDHSFSLIQNPALHDCDFFKSS